MGVADLANDVIIMSAMTEAKVGKIRVSLNKSQFDVQMVDANTMCFIETLQYLEAFNAGAGGTILLLNSIICSRKYMKCNVII